MLDTKTAFALIADLSVEDNFGTKLQTWTETEYSPDNARHDRTPCSRIEVSGRGKLIALNADDLQVVLDIAEKHGVEVTTGNALTCGLVIE